MMRELVIERGPGPRQRLRLAGPLCAGARRAIEGRVVPVFPDAEVTLEPRELTLDLRRVTSVDSLGLGALQQALLRFGRVVCLPPPPWIPGEDLVRRALAPVAVFRSADKPETDDGRRFPRVAVRLPAELSLEGRACRAATLNVSLGGALLLLAASVLVPPGAEVACVFDGLRLPSTVARQSAPSREVALTFEWASARPSGALAELLSARL